MVTDPIHLESSVRTSRRRRATATQERTNLSPLDHQQLRVRVALRATIIVVIAILAIISAAPMLWLAKSALSTVQDIVREPFGLWPSGIQWGNLAYAWDVGRIGTYMINTVWLTLGSWFFGLLVTLTGAYGIAILRPRYAKIVNGGVLATLFIPGVVSLVSQYLTVLDVPLIGINLLNTFWAVWLPGAAHAFLVLVVTRFFANIPMEITDAAKIDGAGNTRTFFQLILPMSKPVIGVVSLLIFVSSWKEFMWPLLVLSDSELHPLSVGLYKLAETAGADLVMAGSFISVIVPVVLFLLFQRHFLRGAGNLGAVKG